VAYVTGLGLDSGLLKTWDFSLINGLTCVSAVLSFTSPQGYKCGFCQLKQMKKLIKISQVK
jgi:hypothetical protein